MSEKRTIEVHRDDIMIEWQCPDCGQTKIGGIESVGEFIDEHYKKHRLRAGGDDA